MTEESVLPCPKSGKSGKGGKSGKSGKSGKGRGKSLLTLIKADEESKDKNG